MLFGHEGQRFNAFVKLLLNSSPCLFKSPKLKKLLFSMEGLLVKLEDVREFDGKLLTHSVVMRDGKEKQKASRRKLG